MERPYKSQKSEVRSQNEDFVIVIICSLFLISYFLFPSYVVLHGWETQPRASRAISYFLFPTSYSLPYPELSKLFASDYLTPDESLLK
jgi:predicted permease